MGYQDVQTKIARAVQQAGRASNSVRLIAVSKTKPAQAVREVYALGQRHFGENYVNELIAKAEALSDLPDLKWVYIGQLQTNKIQKLVAIATEIQTIACEKHARYVERYAADFERNQFPVWIHVNADQEDQKFGASPDEAKEIAKFIVSACPHLELQGIMAIPPAKYSDESCGDVVPILYKSLTDLARSIGRGKLSLGMTGDLNIAIAAGTDCVRIGSAIFGKRA